MTKFGIAFVIIILIFKGASSQNRRAPLGLGDTLPKKILDNLLTATGEKIYGSELEGKIVILDFWSYGCKSCIAGFPKMEKLQEEFTGKLKVLLVNYYDSWKYLKSIGFPNNTKSNIIRNTKLPFIIDNEDLKSLFPHQAEPYHVWIDRGGIIRAMTDASYANTHVISEILQSNNFDKISIKNIFEETVEGRTLKTDNIKYYSILFQGRHGNSNEVFTDSATGKFLGFRLSNRSILDLFSRLYNVGLDRVILNTNMPDKFYAPEDQSSLPLWNRNNLYSYEIFCELDLCNEKMKTDLECYFKLKSYKLKMKCLCFVISRTLPDSSTVYKNLIKNQNSQSSFIESSGFTCQLFNIEFGHYIEVLQQNILKSRKPKGFPLIDESRLNTTKVTMTASSNLFELAELNTQLSKYGLVISKEEREIDLVIIEDNNPKTKTN